MKRLLLLLCVLWYGVLVGSASAVTIDEIKPVVGKPSCTTNFSADPYKCVTPKSTDDLVRNTENCSTDGSVCTLSMEYRIYEWDVPDEYKETIGLDYGLKIYWNGRILLTATYRTSDRILVTYGQSVYYNTDPCPSYKLTSFYSYNVAKDGTPEAGMKLCKFVKYYKDLTPKEQKTGFSETITTTTAKPDDDTTQPTTTSNLKDCKKIRIDGDLYKLETKNIKCLKARKMAKRLYEQDKFEMDDEYMIYEKNKIIIKLTIINE